MNLVSFYIFCPFSPFSRSLFIFIFIFRCCFSAFVHLLFYKQTFCQLQTYSYYLWMDFEIKYNLIYVYVYFKFGYPICAQVNACMCLVFYILLLRFSPFRVLLFFFLLTKTLHRWKWDHRYFWNDLIPFFYRLSSEKSIKINETEC